MQGAQVNKKYYKKKHATSTFKKLLQNKFFVS